jgi:hypothetical protein
MLGSVTACGHHRVGRRASVRVLEDECIGIIILVLIKDGDFAFGGGDR